MKSRLYYVLYFLYVIVVAFVLYLNGVFTGEEISVVNLSINIGFLIVIGIVFIISSVSFGRLNRIIYDLEDAAIRLQKEYKESGGKNLWGNYKDNDKVFEEKVLQAAFDKYRLRVRGAKTRRSAASFCDLGEYLNEDLLDRAGMNFFQFRGFRDAHGSGHSGDVSGALHGSGRLQRRRHFFHLRQCGFPAFGYEGGISHFGVRYLFFTGVQCGISEHYVGCL